MFNIRWKNNSLNSILSIFYKNDSTSKLRKYTSDETDNVLDKFIQSFYISICLSIWRITVFTIFSTAVDFIWL